MAERQEASIVFLPTAVRPAKNDPWEQCAALLLNPCDGFHLVYAYFDGDGEFDRFSDFASSDPYADDFYVAWALLPDESPLIGNFDPKRRPHGVPAAPASGCTYPRCGCSVNLHTMAGCAHGVSGPRAQTFPQDTPMPSKDRHPVRED